MKKKFVTGLCTMAILGMSCFGTNAFGSNLDSMANSKIITSNEENGNIDNRSPFFIAISSDSRGLELGFGGQLICSADTVVRNGYTAKVTVELQQDDGGWSTIKTWTDTYDDFAVVDGRYYVAKGYDYRLKVSHQAYKGSTLIETHNANSSTVTY